MSFREAGLLSGQRDEVRGDRVVGGVERHVERREILRRRAQQAGVDTAELGEIERFHEYVAHGLGSPVLSGDGRDGDENILRSNGIRRIELKGESGRFLGVWYELDPFVDEEAGKSAGGVDRGRRLDDD